MDRIIINNLETIRGLTVLAALIFFLSLVGIWDALAAILTESDATGPRVVGMLVNLLGNLSLPATIVGAILVAIGIYLKGQGPRRRF